MQNNKSVMKEVLRPHRWWWHPEKSVADILLSTIGNKAFRFDSMAETSTTEVSEVVQQIRDLMSVGSSKLAKFGLKSNVKAWEKLAGCPVAECVLGVPRRPMQRVAADWGYTDSDNDNEEDTAKKLLQSSAAKYPTSSSIPVHFFFPTSMLSNAMQKGGATATTTTTTTTDVGLQRVEFDDDTGGISELLKAADEQNIPVIVFMHGGGFTVGDAYSNSVSLVADMLAATTEKGETAPPVVFASIDYSLSPDFCFPTAPLEVLAVVSYLLDAVGVSKIHLAGESAGANFAAVAAMEGVRRYNTGGRIGSLMMYSPGLDPAASSMSCYMNSADGIVTWMRWCWQCYLGLPPPPIVTSNDEDHLAQGSNQTAWNQSKWKGTLWERLVNPTVDLPSNLDDDPSTAPTVLVVTNAGDPLLDDGTAFVEKLKERNKSTELTVRHFQHQGSHTLGTQLDTKGKAEVYQAWAQALFQVQP